MPLNFSPAYYVTSLHLKLQCIFCSGPNLKSYKTLSNDSWKQNSRVILKSQPFTLLKQEKALEINTAGQDHLSKSVGVPSTACNLVSVQLISSSHSSIFSHNSSAALGLTCTVYNVKSIAAALLPTADWIPISQPCWALGWKIGCGRKSQPALDSSNGWRISAQLFGNETRVSQASKPETPVISLVSPSWEEDNHPGKMEGRGRDRPH